MEPMEGSSRATILELESALKEAKDLLVDAEPMFEHGAAAWKARKDLLLSYLEAEIFAEPRDPRDL